MSDDISIAGRIHNAKAAGMHPMMASDVSEGKHYEVLAYTDWADLFIPTVVKWANGEIDRFNDPAVTRNNRRESLQLVERQAD